MQRPKLVVQDVATQIAPEEFMAELYANNLREHIPEAEFRKAVHLDTKPWTVADGATVSVTLECEPKVLDLLEGGRIYIKWFSYRCRALVRTYACHRCVGFNHKVAECKQKDNVCRQCGQSGHSARSCTNPVDCRNCRFYGHPSGHSMLSPSCPVYAAVLARVNSRH